MSKRSHVRSAALTSRADAYRSEVEKIVALGMEHPTCELKAQLDFAQAEDCLHQNCTRSRKCTPPCERLLVIGADEAARQEFELFELQNH